MLNRDKLVEITLALPAYNEEKNIKQVIDSSIVFLDQLGQSWEILVVDNCSTDTTVQIVKEYTQRDSRIRLILHDENKLYSGSCQTVLSNALGKCVMIMDSDGQFVVEDIPKFQEKIKAGANFVMGWRKDRNDPFMRLLTSWIFNFLGKFWLNYPLHDLNCGIRMFDRKFIECAKINHRINMVNPEFYMIVKRNNLIIDEVPIQHFERTAGNTSHNFAKSWKIFKDVNGYLKALKKESKSHC